MKYFIKDQNNRAALAEKLEDASGRTSKVSKSGSFPDPLSREDSLALLKRSLSTRPADRKSDPISDPRPTIFLSIDVEGEDNINEVGLSVFNADSIDFFMDSEMSPIISYNFRVCAKGKNRLPRRTKPFIFGDTQKVPYDKLTGFLSELSQARIENFNEPAELVTLFAPKDAELVIIGHDIKKDMRSIETNCPGFWKTMNPTAVIDLACMYGQVRLRAVLEDLSIGAEVSERWLHCAGNDSNFTLRAVILSLVRHLDDVEAKEYLETGTMKLIETIALKNIPEVVRCRKSGGRKEEFVGYRNSLGSTKKRRMRHAWRQVVQPDGSAIKSMADALNQLPDGCLETLYE